MADALRRFSDCRGHVLFAVSGFCKSAMLEEIRKHGHVLTPGCYVGAAGHEDDSEPFEEKKKRFTATLCEQMQRVAGSTPRSRPT
jgi:type I restriction-modification system DNA methylase subunit